MEITPKIAECVGLWLAEGDNKTKYEITFTNNCLVLVKLFNQEVISKYSGNPRIYIYSRERNIEFELDNCAIKQYMDIRANKPYFVLRLASVKVVRDWKIIVEKVKKNPKFYADILRGFFAGEGNIKTGSHSNRTIRIAQKQPTEWVNNILDFFGVSYSFAERERSYVITGSWNWKKFAEIRLADLHPQKKERFWSVYKSFKEEHYPNNYIKNKLLKRLTEPCTTKELAIDFNRSKARINDVLCSLKEAKIIRKFNIRSNTFWIRNDSNKIIISDVKRNYLDLLEGNRTSDIAKLLNVCWKSANRRLSELERLNLVVQDKQTLWKIVPTIKEIIVK
jgi:predicted transcriptional regulator